MMTRPSPSPTAVANTATPGERKTAVSSQEPEGRLPSAPFIAREDTTKWVHLICRMGTAEFSALPVG